MDLMFSVPSLMFFHKVTYLLIASFYLADISKIDPMLLSSW